LTSDLRAHSHCRLRQSLSKLNRLTERIARTRLVPVDFMDCLQRRLLALEDALETDLTEQECSLFPRIEELAEPSSQVGAEEPGPNELHDALSQAALANCGVQCMMEHVQMCLCDPEWADKGPLVEDLIDAVREFEEALADYVELETDVLFPQADKMAQTLAPDHQVADRKRRFRL
jgi:iron-sulfur cluster repair protein YtfE (RIC family)